MTGVVSVILLGSLGGGCASPPGESVYATPILIRPVTRTVESLDSGLPKHVASIRRPPGLGIDSTAVDCETVRRLGIRFIADTSQLGAFDRAPAAIHLYAYRVELAGGRQDIVMILSQGIQHI